MCKTKNTDNCHFLMQEEGKNEKLPFQRKGQGRVNYYPFDREPYANKAKQIKVNQPWKGSGDIGSAQERKGITKD